MDLAISYSNIGAVNTINNVGFIRKRGKRAKNRVVLRDILAISTI